MIQNDGRVVSAGRAPFASNLLARAAMRVRKSVLRFKLSFACDCMKVTGSCARSELAGSLGAVGSDCARGEGRVPQGM